MTALAVVVELGAIRRALSRLWCCRVCCATGRPATPRSAQRTLLRSEQFVDHPAGGCQAEGGRPFTAEAGDVVRGRRQVAGRQRRVGGALALRVTGTDDA